MSLPLYSNPESRLISDFNLCGQKKIQACHHLQVRCDNLCVYFLWHKRWETGHAYCQGLQFRKILLIICFSSIVNNLNATTSTKIQN